MKKISNKWTKQFSSNKNEHTRVEVRIERMKGTLHAIVVMAKQLFFIGEKNLR